MNTVPMLSLSHKNTARCIVHGTCLNCFRLLSSATSSVDSPLSVSALVFALAEKVLSCQSKKGVLASGNPAGVKGWRCHNDCCACRHRTTPARSISLYLSLSLERRMSTCPHPRCECPRIMTIFVGVASRLSMLVQLSVISDRHRTLGRGRCDGICRVRQWEFHAVGCRARGAELETCADIDYQKRGDRLVYVQLAQLRNSNNARSGLPDSKHATLVQTCDLFQSDHSVAIRAR